MGQHIFLSYSRKDIHMMQSFRDDLLAEGLTVWTDEALNTGSQSWKQDIENAIENASALVVILTPNSKKSIWVREEMNYAEAQDVRIFPVLADGEPKDSVPFGFITAQWVDLRSDAEYDYELQKLIFTLRGHVALEIAEDTSEITQDIPAVVDDAPAGTDQSDTAPKTTLAPDAPTRRRRNNVVFPSNISKAIMVLQDRSSKWWRRMDAINHIANLNDPITVPVLEAYLEDKDIDVRRAAEQAIDRLQHEAPTTEPETTDLETNLSDDGVLSNVNAMPPGDDETAVRTFNGNGINGHHAQSDIHSEAAKDDDHRLKLVITGPTDDLRTRFIRAISEIKPVTINRDLKSGKITGDKDAKTTAAMSFGRITVEDELKIYLFGMPGQRHFDFMWKILGEGMLGFVFIVDSTQPQTFRDAKAIFEKFHDQAHVPYVIAADNAKQVDAWRPVDIRIAMRLDNDATIIPVDSHDPASVKQVLLQLIYHISDDETPN